MVDMVLYQCSFGLQDGFLHSMKLLCDVDAGPLVFDHVNDAQQMAIGTFQPHDNIGVGCVVDVFCHMNDVTPKRDEASGPKPVEMGRMRRQVKVYLRGVLAVSLVVGMFLSSNSRIISHDIADLPMIVAETHAEIEEHGHTHEDIVDVMHAYHGHAHDVADHDHNTAFLPPRAASGILAPPRTNWALAKNALPDHREFDLDRPPRV